MLYRVVPNRLLEQTAGMLEKPDGLSRLSQNNMSDRIADMPPDKMHGPKVSRYMVRRCPGGILPGRLDAASELS